MASERVRLADIRDKDDAHPHGVVGWRREYHAMREALDAVLSEHAPDAIHCCTGCGSNESGGAIVPWPCPTVRAIESVIDLGG